MLAYIKGILESVTPEEIVVENHGIGYAMGMSQTSIQKLPSIGCEVKIYTYMYVREDACSLFGFLTRDDLEIFKLLITVSGIGPKGAQGILSVMSGDDLRFAVAAGDEKQIVKAPGIGKKTAQRLIIDLKDKLRIEDAFETETVQNIDSPASHQVVQEVIMALTALGYGQTEAAKAVRMIADADGMDSEAVLKLALKNIMIM